MIAGRYIYLLCPNRGKVVPLTLKATRLFSFTFLPEYPFFIAVGAVELWVTRSVIQAPRGQARSVVHQVRQIQQPNLFRSYDIKEYFFASAMLCLPLLRTGLTPCYSRFTILPENISR
jgi:hypothetical protein